MLDAKLAWIRWFLWQTLVYDDGGKKSVEKELFLKIDNYFTNPLANRRLQELLVEQFQAHINGKFPVGSCFGVVLCCWFQCMSEICKEKEEDLRSAWLFQLYPYYWRLCVAYGFTKFLNK